jgi:hypothetical protein
MVALSRLPAAALVASFGTFAACGASPTWNCTFPPIDGLEGVLQGTWNVYNATGEHEGEIRFDRRQVVAESGDVLYLGTWVLGQSEGRTNTVDLVFDSASTAGIPAVYATPTRLTLHLAFDHETGLFALQPDGVWTRWRRVDPYFAEPSDTDEAAP